MKKKKEINQFKERMKGSVPLVFVAIAGIVIGILMLCGVFDYNTSGVFDTYAPYLIIFLSGYSLYVAIREIKKAYALKEEKANNEKI